MDNAYDVLPHNEILRTIPEVARYMRVSEKTIRRWYKRFGFPLIKIPSGVYVSSYWLIDAWLMARLKYQRDHPRSPKRATK